MKHMKVGSEAWWRKGVIHGSHGIVDAIMYLVVQHHISKGKGRELIEDLFCRRKKGIPPAPWEEVRFGGTEPCPIGMHDSQGKKETV